MVHKRLLLIILIAFSLCILFGCNNSFDNLIIDCEDVVNAPEGEYTLVYTIKDYKKWAEKYSLDIRVKVFDQNNKEVEVKNNRTIKVEVDYIYTVVVYCSTTIDGEIVTKQRQFTVTAEKSPLKVQLYLRYNDNTTNMPLHEEFEVAYGQNFDIINIPSKDDIAWNPDYKDGENKVLVDKKWMILIDGEAVELNQSHLNNITKTLKIYLWHDFVITKVTLKYIFHSNGGSNVATIENYEGNSINKPNSPTKDGYTFDGWYTDENFAERYNWKDAVILKNHNLYAKWLKQVQDHSPFDNFDFELKVDNYDYEYYTITAKNSQSLDGQLNLPNGYNNIPITTLGLQAFKDATIIGVYIPNSITVFGQSSFENCQNLLEVTFEEGNKMEAMGWYSFKDCINLLSFNNFPLFIENLGAQTFFGCQSLQSFVLGQQLLDIKQGLFQGCSSLQQIIIPDSVIVIHKDAFADCENLESILISMQSSLEEINKSALDNTKVTAIVLPYYFVDKDNPFDSTDIIVSCHPKFVEEE